MNYPKIKNELALTALTFGAIGFVLLVGVMVFHQPINTQLTIASEKDSSVVLDVESGSNPVPDEIVQEITQDERNILGYTSSDPIFESLTPAMKFLYTISSNNLFLTQE